MSRITAEYCDLKVSIFSKNNTQPKNFKEMRELLFLVGTFYRAVLHLSVKNEIVSDDFNNSYRRKVKTRFIRR